MEEELEENETEALAEDDPAKRDEGVLMQDESESGKGAGHAKEAGGKKINMSWMNLLWRSWKSLKGRKCQKMIQLC